MPRLRYFLVHSLRCALHLAIRPVQETAAAPVVQGGRVVGLLLSLNMHTWKGIAISAEFIIEVSERKS